MDAGTSTTILLNRDKILSTGQAGIKAPQFTWFTSTRVQILTPEELRVAAVGVFLEKLNVYKATADVEAGLEMYKRYTEERLKLN